MKTGPVLPIYFASGPRTVHLVVISSFFCPGEALKGILMLSLQYPPTLGWAFLLVFRLPVSPGRGPPPFFPANQDPTLRKGFHGFPAAYNPSPWPD